MISERLSPVLGATVTSALTLKPQVGPCVLLLPPVLAERYLAKSNGIAYGENMYLGQGLTLYWLGTASAIFRL